MSNSDLTDSIDLIVREPIAWLAAADRVKRAADLIADRYQAEAQAAVRAGSASDAEAPPSLAPVYLMLAGYAIENLAKAVIVAQSDDPESLRWVTKNHLGAAMLDKACIALQNGQADLVDRLAHHITWAGRYPAPNKRDAQRFASTVAARGSWWGNPTRISTDDARRVNELFGQIRAIAVAMISPPSAATST